MSAIPGRVAAFSLLSFLCVVQALAAQGRDTTGRATNLHHEEAAALDGHTHMGFSVDSLGRVVGSSLDYLDERGFRASVFVMPVDRSETNDLLGRLKRETDQLQRLSSTGDSFKLISTPEEYENRSDQSETQIFLGLEYFNGIFAGDPMVVDKLKGLGIVYVTLLNSAKDRLMIVEEDETRLTELGRQIISQMNKRGVLIDVSHLEEEEILAVIEFSSVPVIASHANPSAMGNPRSELTDELLRALAARQGFVFVSFNKSDLFQDANSGADGIDKFVDHLDYVQGFIGVDRIGIGTDLQANGRYVPEGLQRTDVMRRLRSTMIARGYTPEEIDNVFAQNFIRFWRRGTEADRN